VLQPVRTNIAAKDAMITFFIITTSK